MKKNTILKLAVAIALLIITIIFAISDNELIFPSALVGSLLTLTLIGTEDAGKTEAGKYAKRSITIFSVIVIALNLLITVFLPMLGSSYDLSGMSVELTTNIGTSDTREVANHFIAVTINDMHELCFSTSVLLLINIAFLLVNRLQSNIQRN